MNNDIDRPVGVGLVGCGIIARTAHLPAWSRLRHQARVIAVADVREQAAREAAESFGIGCWQTDYRHLLERSDIRIIDVCTPEFLHAEQVLAAISAGKHVICEKPIASSLPEAKAMLAAAEQARVKFMIGHTRRFTPRYVKLKQHVDAGTVGPVRIIREIERRPRDMWATRGYQTWKPEGDRSWGANPLYSKGLALHSAIHELDLFQWFMADRPTSIYAQAMVTRTGGQLPDHMIYSVRFKNGGLAYSDQSANQPPDYPFYHAVEICGTKGMLRANDSESVTLSMSDKAGLHVLNTFDTLLLVLDGYINQMHHFVDCVRFDRPVSVPPMEAYRALATALAAIESVKRGQPVPLSDEA